MAIQKDTLRDVKSIEDSPVVSESINSEVETYPDGGKVTLPSSTVDRMTHTSSVLSVLVSGIALFSDGYNAQIIGYMEPLFSTL